MNKRNRVVGLSALLAVVLLTGVGCEKTSTSQTLAVTPPASEIDLRAAVVLTAAIPAAESETRRIYYPLEWTVSDGALGSLRDAAADTAVYVASDSEGVNTVTVRDQAGAEGIASVVQKEPQVIQE